MMDCEGVESAAQWGRFVCVRALGNAGLCGALCSCGGGAVGKGTGREGKSVCIGKLASGGFCVGCWAAVVGLWAGGRWAGCVCTALCICGGRVVGGLWA